MTSLAVEDLTEDKLSKYSYSHGTYIRSEKKEKKQDKENTNLK